MKCFYKISLVAIAVVCLSGCASIGQEQNDTAVAATPSKQVVHKVVIAGDRVVIGPVMADTIGQDMDELDRVRFNRVLETQQTGRTSKWVNPTTQNEYAVTPTRTYASDNKPCRAFTILATINGEQQNITGTACRQSRGIWHTN